jgi:TatD DNase family protein
MKLIDVHCHLDHARFDGDLDDVVRRFEEVGGKLIVQNGVNSKTNRVGLELARKYDVVKCAFGIYPTDALAAEMEGLEAAGFSRDDKFDVDSELVWIEDNAGSCVALGEVGMDFAFDGCDEEMKERQRVLFRKVLRLAEKKDLPVIVHSRKAEVEVVDMLEEEGMRKVVMHCFCGKKKLIRRGVELGWFFSVPPAIVRWENFKMLVGEVPLGQLLTETDAPYLGPVLGERNESSNVLVTLEEIAKIKGVSKEEVGERVWENACGLFGVK